MVICENLSIVRLSVCVCVGITYSSHLRDFTFTGMLSGQCQND